MRWRELISVANDPEAEVVNEGLCFSDRRSIQCVDVNLRAIHERKSARASIEREEEVGPGEKDDLSTLIAAQALTNRKQLTPLFVRHFARERHGDVGPMNLVECVPLRDNN